MKKLPRRFGHFVYGTIQSGLTSGIASGIASAGYLEEGIFLRRWVSAWAVSWAVMMPLVLLAAPLIRRLTHLIAHDES